MTIELGTITSIILGASALCVAITNIIKFFKPVKDYNEKKEKEQEDKMQIIANSAISSYNLEVDKKIEYIQKTVDSINQQLKEMVMLNAEQTSSLSSLDEKIDKNEIDRLRWEVLSFSDKLRNGSSVSQEEFRHIFKIYKKYEDILEERKMTNGEVDTEYKFIQEEYLKKN